MKTTSMTNAMVLGVVRRHVERHQRPGKRLKVLDDAILHVAEGVPEGDDRWYVAVRADPEDGSHYEWFSDVVMRISEEIEEEEGLVVYLQSLLPHY